MTNLLDMPRGGSDSNEASDREVLDAISELEKHIKERGDRQSVKLTETQIQMIAATALNIGELEMSGEERAKFLRRIAEKILCIAASLDHPQVHSEQHRVVEAVWHSKYRQPTGAQQNAINFWAVVGYDGDLTTQGLTAVEGGLSDAMRFLRSQRGSVAKVD